MGNKHNSTNEDRVDLPKTNRTSTTATTDIGRSNVNNGNTTITLSKSHKTIKRKSNQLIELFHGSMNVNTTTFSYNQERQLFVIDIVPLYDPNHKEKTLVLICGDGVMEAYIIDFKHDNQMNYIYFEHKSDVFSKVESIAIHANNKYLCLQSNNIINIYNMDIDYKNFDFIKLSRSKNVCSIHLKYEKKYNYWTRYSRDNTLFLGDENNDNLNELLLIKQQPHASRGPYIVIYNFKTNTLLYEFVNDHNVSKNETLYSSFRKIKINNIYYDRQRKHLILIRWSCWIEIYDISQSQNNKVVMKKIIAYKDDTDHRNDYHDQGIQIVSLSPNGKYLLTSPKHIDWMDDVGLRKPFKIYKIDYIKNELQVCNFTADNMNEFEYGYRSQSTVDYDSDIEPRYQDSGCDYPYDHQSFEWITDNMFIYVIDELNGHHHFGELVIINLDNYTLTEQHKISITQTIRDKYNIIIHRDIVELIAECLNGMISPKFQNQNIYDHGYRHPKNEIVHCRENKLFAVCGTDRSIRIHKYC